jgi:hypothetical protein
MAVPRGVSLQYSWRIGFLGVGIKGRTVIGLFVVGIVLYIVHNQ